MNQRYKLFFLIVLASVTSSTQAEITSRGEPITRSVDLAFTGLYELSFQLTPVKNLTAGIQQHDTRLANFTISSKHPCRLGFRLHPSLQEGINHGVIKGRADPKHVLEIMSFSNKPNTIRGDDWMLSIGPTTLLEGNVHAYNGHTVPADIYTLIMEASAFVS
ncbi:hypothetical protein IBT49_03395 [Erwinia sp. S63]|uniref:hypothetical protein n=1 Tax=Erwinia sp. S63 TaxID=2769341 RepID=UPI00190C1C26|nr:hypothetical protein [Erwinia sp. S63]MBK0095007.1 hypothetical protein [Erwinia sp. S63]